MFSHFRLQEFWGNSSLRHFSNLGCENIGRDQISPKFLAPSLLIDARILGILGKFDPCRCFRISGFRNFGEIRAWRHFSNLGRENIGRDQISPKFLAPSLPIDARILGILGKFDPCRCFRISGFRNFGEIRAWRHFSNLGCENIGMDCKYHYNSIMFSIINIFNYHIVILALLLLVVVLMVVEYMWFLLPVVLQL